MRIAIIGAGNMGGATARGLAKSTNHEIVVSNPSQPKLDALKAEFPHIIITNDNKVCAQGADLVVLAVKPWKIEGVIAEILPVLAPETMLASMAGGISATEIATLAGAPRPVFQIIPNTAIAQLESMTFISAHNTTPAQDTLITELFAKLGKAMLLEERQMPGAMALASCGIAYAFRYIRAAMEGGVELGLFPAQAQEIVQQTLKGAVAVLEANGTHPEQEIDRVTTPGGFTIRGLNAMEANGFTTSVIEGLKASANNK